jgi:hypothetical protein
MKKYNLLCLLLCSHVMHGMLVAKKYVRPLNVAYNRDFCLKKEVYNSGLQIATTPQTSKGVLGYFRLDKTYGVRDYLGQYIAFDKKISLGEARWENFDVIKKAYKQFLTHNSSDAIQAALNNNVIDKDYAVQALYFTYKVVRKFQEHIEYQQHFAHAYANDPEQYIWVDNDAFKSNRFDMLREIKHEKKTIVSLVDFLEQKPENKKFDLERFSENVFKKKRSDYNGWTLKTPIQYQKIAHVHVDVKPATVAQTWEGILGNFGFSKKQKSNNRGIIQDYLCKYIARNLQISEDAVEKEATFLDIKKAFKMFVKHNHPDAILRDFEYGLINKQHAKDALLFTGWVIHAFEEYLGEISHYDASEKCLIINEMEIFELFWIVDTMKDKLENIREFLEKEWSSANKE